MCAIVAWLIDSKVCYTTWILEIFSTVQVPEFRAINKWQIKITDWANCNRIYRARKDRAVWVSRILGWSHWYILIGCCEDAYSCITLTPDWLWVADAFAHDAEKIYEILLPCMVGHHSMEDRFWIFYIFSSALLRVRPGELYLDKTVNFTDKCMVFFCLVSSYFITNASFANAITSGSRS